MIPDKCVNGGLLNDDILIKTKWYLVNGGLLMMTKWYLTNVSIVVYWMMIFWLKQSDTCVNGGLLKDDTLIVIPVLMVIDDDILIKTKWYLCQWWFIEWWYFD